MPKKHYPNDRENTVQIAIVFFAIVFFLVFVASIFKLIAVVKKSKFDGEHRFTLVVDIESSSKGPQIISFAPDAKTISLASFAESGQVSAHAVGKRIEAPIDGEVWVDDIVIDVSKGQDASSILLTLLSRYPSLRTNLTIIDFIRLLAFSRSVPKGSYVYELYPDAVDEVSSDKITTSLFLDSALSAEKMSIHIINGTGVSGLGNRLARLITNMGGNVISVTSAQEAIEKSKISCVQIDNALPYTCRRLSYLLGGDMQASDNRGISDVEIIIGKEGLSSLMY